MYTRMFSLSFLLCIRQREENEEKNTFLGTLTVKRLFL